MKPIRYFAAVLLTLSAIGSAHAETIRVAIGTQDTTINCATGGLLIRELKLLEKFLPHDGKYKDATYDIQWKNFTSGAPLTNEMVAGKLDIGSMADFPGSFNGAAFAKAGQAACSSACCRAASRAAATASSCRRLAGAVACELKGKTISVPFASTAHGICFAPSRPRAGIRSSDVNIITQAPEVAGSALQAQQDRRACRLRAVCRTVPVARLRPQDLRRLAGQCADLSWHARGCRLCRKTPGNRHAFLRAALEADRLLAAEPEKYSELIAKVTGIEAEVIYLFHGPLGLQTRDFTWKPEYRQAEDLDRDPEAAEATDGDLDVDASSTIVHPRRFEAAGLDYEAAVEELCASSRLEAKDALYRRAHQRSQRVAQIWVKGEPKVRHYASPRTRWPRSQLEKEGKTSGWSMRRTGRAASSCSPSEAWFVRDGQQAVSAFLLKGEAEGWAQAPWRRGPRLCRRARRRRAPERPIAPRPWTTIGQPTALRQATGLQAARCGAWVAPPSLGRLAIARAPSPLLAGLASGGQRSSWIWPRDFSERAAAAEERGAAPVAAAIPEASYHLRTSLIARVRRLCGGLALADRAGTCLGRSRLARDLLLPPLEVLRPIPAVAWIPLAILMFPSSELSMMFITFIGALFPILLNTVHGVEGVDPRLIASARSLGAGAGRSWAR